MEIFAILVCLHSNDPNFKVHSCKVDPWYGTYRSADDCQRKLHSISATAPANFTMYFSCVKKTVSVWEPVE